MTKVLLSQILENCDPGNTGDKLPRNICDSATSGGTDPLLIVFFLSTLIMTIVLLWGLRTVIISLNEPLPDGGKRIARMLSEKDDRTGPAGGKGAGEDTSFSRVAGAFGAMALSAAFVGVSYWMLYSLFFGKDLAVLKTVGWYFVSGATLFAPYAVNKLSTIFKLG